MSPTYKKVIVPINPRLPSDPLLRSLYEELGSCSPFKDKMDNDYLFDLLQKHRLDQDEVVGVLWGPAKLLVCRTSYDHGFY